MSGVEIVGGLLHAYDALTQLVPVERIKAGALPDGVTLPAILVRTVSVADFQPLKRGAMFRSTERVSVAVRAASYDEQKLVIRLIRAGCAGWTGAIADCVNVSVLTAGLGPDVGGPANSFEQTQDFRVSFDAPA